VERAEIGAEPAGERDPKSQGSVRSDLGAEGHRLAQRRPQPTNDFNNLQTNARYFDLASHFQIQ
jgi:hypothetical protein